MIAIRVSGSTAKEDMFNQLEHVEMTRKQPGKHSSNWVPAISTKMGRLYPNALESVLLGLC